MFWLSDAHCHFWGYAGDLYKCQLVGTRSFEEVLEKVNAYASESKSGFIYGRGWDQNDWDVKEFPDNKKLNAMFPETPVFLKRIDGHAVLVNEAFFRLAAEEAAAVKHIPSTAIRARNFRYMVEQSPEESGAMITCLRGDRNRKALRSEGLRSAANAGRFTRPGCRRPVRCPG